MLDALFHIDGYYFSAALFFVGVLTGRVGAMGGSGGLILLPFMILSGFSPVLALGTARLAAIPPWAIAVAKFKKAGHLRVSEVFYLSMIGLLAVVIGTYLVLNLDDKYIYPVIGVALLAAAPLSFLKKDFGTMNTKHSRGRDIIGSFMYFLVMLYGGFFGAGAGILAVFTLVGFKGFKMLEAHSTHMAVWVVVSLVSSAIFILNEQVSYYHAFIIFIGMSIGSVIGSKVAIAQGDRWMKIVICAFAFIIGLKLLWNEFAA